MPAQWALRVDTQRRTPYLLFRCTLRSHGASLPHHVELHGGCMSYTATMSEHTCWLSGWVQTPALRRVHRCSYAPCSTTITLAWWLLGWVQSLVLCRVAALVHRCMWVHWCWCVDCGGYEVWLCMCVVVASVCRDTLHEHTHTQGRA